jgi:hypothetical protein
LITLFPSFSINVFIVTPVLVPPPPLRVIVPVYGPAPDGELIVAV